MLWKQFLGIAILCLALTQLRCVNSQATDTICNEGFTLVGDKCLMMKFFAINWFAADSQCQSLGAGLLTLQNEEQLLQINKWVNMDVQIWTSGNKLSNNGVYYWQNTEAEYLPWAENEPDPSSGNCLILTDMSGGSETIDFRLRVEACLIINAYICEQLTQSVETNQVA
ncbi:C-type lectin 37Da [Drosophila grimshawi]|uniref:GH25234 n=1 Tax=Drosophila grimshawi TaxID=7222 RepID=B4K216_DROGR|nr:C-type lectin 37Da [Drosophila grimshawi]EDW04465.1 GH25234 [Drosophila grimshawi]